MDGPEGEVHVELGAKIMHALFDWGIETDWESQHLNSSIFKKTWYDFTRFHSRYYAKQYNRSVSKLAYADKLAFCLTPRWMYLPMVKASGEIEEYLAVKKYGDLRNSGMDLKVWHKIVYDYIEKWVYENKDGG